MSHSEICEATGLPLGTVKSHIKRGAERLHQPYGWSRLGRALIGSSRTALSGVATGILAPFRLRSGHIGLMAASAAVLAIWATLQGV